MFFSIYTCETEPKVMLIYVLVSHNVQKKKKCFSIRRPVNVLRLQKTVNSCEFLSTGSQKYLHFFSPMDSAYVYFNSKFRSEYEKSYLNIFCGAAIPTHQRTRNRTLRTMFKL